MTNIKYIIVLCFILFSCKEKSGKLNYEIFQIEKTDSLNGHISKIVKYNENGQIEYEKLIDFISNQGWARSDEEIMYFYKDSLLVKTLKKHFSVFQDSSRIEFFYNDKHQLVKRLNYLKYRPLKKDTLSGCIVFNEDFETISIWELTNSELFKYNKDGLQIERYIPENAEYQNRFLFEYDNNGKIIKESNLRENELIEVIVYEYVENGYNLISDSGRIGNDEYRYIKDKNGIILQEQKKWNGAQMYRIEKVYDGNNRIIVEKGYNNKDELIITHKYNYQVVK